MSSMQVHHGRCLCGAITYSVSGTPKIVAHCHCEDCQRLSGTGHLPGAMYSVEQFKLSGEVGEYKLKSENDTEVTRVFCQNCGSPILGKNSGMPGFVTITLGTLDDSTEFEPEVIIFSRNQKKWDTMSDSLMIFETQPDWNPSDEIA